MAQLFSANLRLFVGEPGDSDNIIPCGAFLNGGNAQIDRSVAIFQRIDRIQWID